MTTLQIKRRGGMISCTRTAAVLMVATAFTGSLDEMTGSDGCHQLTRTIRDLKGVTSNIEEITATRTLCNALMRLAGN
jgi:hypothetical protein